MHKSERRLIGRALRYWQGIAGQRSCPSLEELETQKDETIWSHAFVIEADGEHKDYVFRHCGRSLAERVGRNVTGSSVAHLPSEVASGALDLCAATIWAGKPIASSSQLFGPPGNEIRYRVILLPVGETDGQVSSLFGVASHRMFEIP